MLGGAGAMRLRAAFAPLISVVIAVDGIQQGPAALGGPLAVYGRVTAKRPSSPPLDAGAASGGVVRRAHF
ncbi:MULTISPECIES: hypothetical protein [Rhizobium]|uniref:hypothetical protein n=1 Tax=Rhizobium TaxID=379 RepID=UPI00056284F7|nr:MULTISPECIES: hypothetical protein [Rhizobium]MCS0458565.1 hypothetical protein [Rhizobium favelukesii]UFS81374.1 hypothetical protein LPB79_24125 [Rhizobium sp. T136]